MSLEDAWEVTVSRQEAKMEIAAHGCDFAEFLADCGDFAEYSGSNVLGWLGY